MALKVEKRNNFVYVTGSNNQGNFQPIGYSRFYFANSDTEVVIEDVLREVKYEGPVAGFLNDTDTELTTVAAIDSYLSGICGPG